jgi:flagellar biogenesis protein FliO
MQALLRIALWTAAVAWPAALLAQSVGGHGGDDRSATDPRAFWSVPGGSSGFDAAPRFDAPPRAAEGGVEQAAYVVAAPADTSAAPPAPPRREPPIPFPGPEASPRDGRQSPLGGVSSLATVGGSLALVVGIFLLVAWMMKRAAPHAATPLPGEVFEVLGRAPLSGRQEVHLLRCGSKLLLVSVTPAGAETLTEITDPPEVDRLAGLCLQAKPGSATETFRRVLEQLTGQGGEKGLREGSPAGGAPGGGAEGPYRSWEGRDA